MLPYFIVIVEYKYKNKKKPLQINVEV